jgi:hypothetical protein
VRGGKCNSDIPAPDNAALFIKACYFEEVCQLLQDDCPDATEDCYPAYPDEGLAICAKPANGMPVGEGNPCMYINNCGESEICVNDGAMQVCRQLCDEASWMTLPVGTGGCPAGRTCVDFDWGQQVWANIGICAP